MEVYDGCYCCVKPSTSHNGHSMTSASGSLSGGGAAYGWTQEAPRDQASMDLDSALNELGMLSTVTDGRREYQREEEDRYRRQQQQRRARASLPPRERNLSESALGGGGGFSAATPSNSPNKPGTCHILQLNTQFVTGFSTGSGGGEGGSTWKSGDPTGLQTLAPPPPQTSGTLAGAARLDFGERYDQAELAALYNRCVRLKQNRGRHNKKPYEFPRRCERMESSIRIEQVMSLPVPIFSLDQGPAIHIDGLLYNSREQELEPPTFCRSLERTGRPPGAEKRCASSNASTPEKKENRTSFDLHIEAASVTRSRSLDDLDLSKLSVTDSENHNFIQERKDIDHVSQRLLNFHVQE